MELEWISDDFGRFLLVFLGVIMAFIGEGRLILRRCRMNYERVKVIMSVTSFLKIIEIHANKLSKYGKITIKSICDRYMDVNVLLF